MVVFLAGAAAPAAADEATGLTTVAATARASASATIVDPARERCGRKTGGTISVALGTAAAAPDARAAVQVSCADYRGAEGGTAPRSALSDPAWLREVAGALEPGLSADPGAPPPAIIVTTHYE